MSTRLAASESTDIQFVPGVGPRIANYYRKLGIETAADLLYHVPRRFEDRRALPRIRDLEVGKSVSVRGVVTRVEMRPSRRGPAPVRAILSDGTGQITLLWFNQPWIGKKLQSIDAEVIAYGLVRYGSHTLEIHSPDFEILGEDDDSASFTSIVPIYPATEGLTQKSIRKAMAGALEVGLSGLEDPLPASVRKKFSLVGLQDAIRQMHRPESEADFEIARRRLAFDEFLAIQLLVAVRRAESKREPGISFPIKSIRGAQSFSLFGPETEWAPGESLADEVARMLPFQLTGAQQRVVNEIWEDMEAPLPMNRLVQGDVGSGKTAVAACAILAAVRCGYQAVLMAPTEILAEQHAASLRKLFEPLGIEVSVHLGKHGVRDRKNNLDLIQTGKARLAIGTHALIQEGIAFQNLGLVVIDEQHRFGVRQRLALRQKAVEIPDVLVLTATPIPRTLSMTLYGDMETSLIDELPPGRKPIKTHWKRTGEREKIYASVDTLLREGRQAYFVCPAIEENEKLQTQAAIDLHRRLSDETFSHYRVGLLHGQMKPAEKEQVMNQFRAHELDILVATVVIEVGVDVPNASVMVIEDAHRFGLAQLHQIRGRVGRGSHQSYCILIADAASDESRVRLETMVETQDGFKIAEVDFDLRGPGDVLGTEQSGHVRFKAANIVRDREILEEARLAATAVISADPDLARPEHAGLAQMLGRARGDDAWISLS